MKCTQKTDLVNDVDQKADPGAINAESEAKDPEVLQDDVVSDSDQEAGPGAVIEEITLIDPRAGNTVDQKADPGAVNAESEAKDPEVLKDDVVSEIDQEAGPGAVIKEIKMGHPSVRIKDGNNLPKTNLTQRTLQRPIQARGPAGQQPFLSEGICKTIVVTHLQTLLVIITCQNNMELVLQMSDA